MRTWKVTKTSKAGHPTEWRSKPWTIVKRFPDGATLYGLWYDFRAKPECWAADLEDAKQMARMFEEND